jgi:hypothetical protein
MDFTLNGAPMSLPTEEGKPAPCSVAGAGLPQPRMAVNRRVPAARTVLVDGKARRHPPRAPAAPPTGK